MGKRKKYRVIEVELQESEEVLNTLDNQGYKIIDRKIRAEGFKKIPTIIIIAKLKPRTNLPPDQNLEITHT